MRRPTIAVTAALLLFASGCSSVPTHGDAIVVGPAPSAGAPADEPDTGRRSGARIKPGAKPEEVVTGFLDAEADTSTDGTVVAQEYLRNPGVWDAEGDTLVYTSKDVAAGVDVSPGVQSIEVTYALLARINANGEYRPDVRRVTHTFEVVNIVGDGWRISSLPRGRRIQKEDLAQVFNRVVPWFYSTLDYDTLVPEPIYQLKGSTKRVYALVSHLVDGPTPVLEDFLPPQLFPSGTKLLTAPEPENRIAELTFNSELNNTTMAVREKIVAQLVWTLTALDSRITAVTVKVNDQPLALPAGGGATDQVQSQWAAYDPDARYEQRLAYFNLNGGLGLYRATFARPGRPLGPRAGQPAVDSTSTTVAVTAPTGTLQELRVAPFATGPWVPQLKSGSLTKPSWGTKEDGAWVVLQDGGQPPRVLSVPAGSREPKAVKAPELDTKVYAFEVAPDGLRVAAIVERNGHRSLEIGFFDRPLFDRAARRVAGFRTVVDGSDVSPLAVAWLDSGKLALVGQAGEDDPEVFTVLVDGSDLEAVDPPTSKRSQRILQSSRTQGVPTEYQLLPLPFEHESARRGSNITPTELMLVIDTKKMHVHHSTGWSELPDVK